MNFLKGLFSWQLILSILLAAALLVGLYFGTFQWLNGFTSHGVKVDIPDLSGKNINEAMKELEALDLRYEIDSVKYSEEYPPLSVIEFFPATGSKVKPGRRVFIKSNPKTWAPVIVPDLIDKSKRLAFTQLTMKGFSVKDTIYEDDPAKDAVLRMELDGKVLTAGTKLPRGTAIDLVIGRGYKMDVPATNVMGLSLEEAEAKLNEDFFVKGQVYYFGKFHEGDNPKVIYQDPAGGVAYDEGLPVTLYLSTKERGQLWRQIDSLDNVYRRNIKATDSIYFNAEKNVKNINLKDLDEDVKNQIQNDFNSASSKRESQLENQNKVNNRRPQIDTTGITIE